MKWLIRITSIVIPVLGWAVFVFLASLEGLWLEPIASDNDGFDRYVASRLENNFPGSAAVALIKDGKIEFQQFKTAKLASNDDDIVDENTVFPLASLSKLITAIAIHKLASDGYFSLDDPIEKYLSTWRLPETGFDNKQVTIAMLLSHTSGLTDGLGFGDYGREEALPTTQESLLAPRASKENKVIEVGVQPGTEFLYSGGGYLILELLVEEITNQPFELWVKANVLDPAGMVGSSYGYLGAIENNSGSITTDGARAEVFQYASSAATALNANIIDLASLIAYLQQSMTDVSPLTQPTAEMMGAYIWGQGSMLYAPLEGSVYIFGHDGSNSPAINTTLRINPETGEAFIALVTGHQSLASELGFEWTLMQSGKPDFVYFNHAIASGMKPMAIGILIWLLLVSWFFVVRKKQR